MTEEARGSRASASYGAAKSPLIHSLDMLLKVLDESDPKLDSWLSNPVESKSMFTVPTDVIF